MISIKLPTPLEEQFRGIVQEDYDGDMQTAIKALLELHEKYGWKQQLLKDIDSVRSEVRQRGGIKAKQIDEAIKRYRKKAESAGE